MTPTAALFDLNGTLLDPSSLAEPLPPGADRDAFADAVLTDTVFLAAVVTITGEYREFGELLRTAAARRLAVLGRPELLEAVAAGAERMRPYPDAGEAIETLRASGLEVGVLTNSSEDAARSILAAAGLEVDRVVGTDAVGVFKPDRRVYEHGVAALGAQAADVVLITAHWWDALGAKRAGMGAAWISRREGERVEADPAPDFEAEDLAEVARLIVGP